AIASAGPKENIKAVLQSLSAANIFQAIVAAEDVHRGKPDPEVYLIAATRLGVPSSRSIVIEDALAGAQGAQSAGMKCIGVSRNGKHLPADIVVRSLDLLPADAFENLVGQRYLSSTPQRPYSPPYQSSGNVIQDHI